MLSRHCPVLYDFPSRRSAALGLSSSACDFFYAPFLHSLSSLADHASMPKNNVTKRIIPTPIRCITANIASIILFSPFFPMILYNMLFWFFLLLYHVLLKCYNWLINSFLSQGGISMYNYQKYESYETFLLYQEFLSIPDNPFSFQIPEGMVMTTDMIHTFLQAAYNAKGVSILDS